MSQEAEKKLGRRTEEDPRPSVIAVEAYLSQASGEETAESSRKGGCAVENTHAAHHLMSLIEHGKIYDNAPEEAAFEGAEQKSRHYQAGKGFGESDKCRHQSPAGNQSGKIVAGFDMFDGPVARNIDENIQDVEH